MKKKYNKPVNNNKRKILPDYSTVKLLDMLVIK